MKRLPLAELADKMSEGISTTNGWDVLCSYGIQALNNTLVAEHTKNTPLYIPLSLTERIQSDVDDTYYTRTFNINFGSPKISFISGSSGFCELRLPISDDSYCQVTLEDGTIKPKKVIPAGEYCISASVPLAHIIGDDIHTTGKIVELGNRTNASVVVHFDTQAAGDSFKILPVPTAILHSTLNSLKNLFAEQVIKVDYNIVHVTVKQEGDVVLNPKSFVFTTSKGEDEDGVLSIWIQTKESGSEVGNCVPSFQPHGVTMLPIPIGHSSSIIFSKKLIENFYLKSQLSSYNPEFTGIDWKNQPAHGITVKLFPTNYEKDYSYYNREAKNHKYTCDKLVIDYHQCPIFLNLYKDQMKLQWGWKQQFHFEWSDGYGAYDSHYGSGNTKITASVDKSFNLKRAMNKDEQLLNDMSFKFRCDISDNDIGIKSENPDGDRTFWDRMRGSNSSSESLNKDITKSIKDTGKININLKSLNYFAEANILFDHQAFKADLDSGINVTGDLIIVGDIS